MSIDEKENNQLRRNMNATLAVAVFLGCALPIAYFLWFSYINDVPPSRTDPGAWGSFGDFVGGLLNPAVAFLALYWLTRSIAIQREELRDTKETLKKANDAQADQTRTLEKQRFEDTFFALLDQHNKVLESLSTATYHQRTKSALELMREHALSTVVKDLGQASKLFKQTDELSSHYFRVLYQLLKLVATKAPNTNLDGDFAASNILESPPSVEEKLYSNIVRSFLSIEVTQLLAINCFCETTSSTYINYKCLLERFEFLEHMPFKVSDIEHPALVETTKHYNRRAFGKSEFLGRLSLDQQASTS